MALFVIDPTRSSVSLAARSSLHPIQGTAERVEGHIEATPSEDGRVVTPTAMHISLPVTALKSGHALYDSTLPKVVDAHKHPIITGSSSEIHADGGDRFAVKGDITFHGVTTSVFNHVRVTVLDGGSVIEVSGEHTFDVRDFGVKPPRLLAFQVYPEVQVQVRVIAVSETPEESGSRPRRLDGGDSEAGAERRPRIGGGSRRAGGESHAMRPRPKSHE